MTAGLVVNGGEISQETSQASCDFLFVTTRERCAGIEALLDQNGFKVDFVENGREALTELAAGSCTVMVADAQLPDMDGIELARAALATQPGLYVLLGVDDPSETLGNIAALAGVAGIVHRPYEPDELFPLLWSIMESQL
ncbi:response regulator [Geobacter grbiciae]|uniref:response regulator n=1 Tax=Geobacter grbiciae TaxID=155042 RepID=UPI001C011B26|nr:response regulator [Geobacter grbiciae]MBT1074236.1 response regulator [Geobacter grbiciae]